MKLYTCPNDGSHLLIYCDIEIFFDRFEHHKIKFVNAVVLYRDDKRVASLVGSSIDLFLKEFNCD